MPDFDLDAARRPLQVDLLYHKQEVHDGGSNEHANLWFQPVQESVKKDRLEVRLHVLICRRQLTPQESQRILRQDWTAGYRCYIEGIYAGRRRAP